MSENVLRHTLITIFFFGIFFLGIHFPYSLVDVNDGGGVVNETTKKKKNTTCWETMAKKRSSICGLALTYGQTREPIRHARWASTVGKFSHRSSNHVQIEWYESFNDTNLGYRIGDSISWTQPTADTFVQMGAERSKSTMKISTRYSHIDEFRDHDEDHIVKASN